MHATTHKNKYFLILNSDLKTSKDVHHLNYKTFFIIHNAVHCFEEKSSVFIDFGIM